MLCALRTRAISAQTDDVLVFLYRFFFFPIFFSLFLSSYPLLPPRADCLPPAANMSSSSYYSFHDELPGFTGYYLCTHTGNAAYNTAGDASAVASRGTTAEQTAGGGGGGARALYFVGFGPVPGKRQRRRRYVKLTGRRRRAL